MRTITENFNIILDRQKSIGYDYYSILNLPANTTDITEVEDKLQISFSHELKEMYSLADGTISERHTANLCGLFPSYDFLNLDEAVYTYSLHENAFAAVYDGIFTVHNYDYTQFFTPQKKMFPIFNDGCGDYYWVDLNDNTKHYGQVLHSSHGEGSYYEFSSLTSMFQTIAECYESNVFLLGDVINPYTGFRPLKQDNEKWGIIGKKNNPEQDIWDDYINLK